MKVCRRGRGEGVQEGKRWRCAGGEEVEVCRRGRGEGV